MLRPFTDSVCQNLICEGHGPDDSSPRVYQIDPRTIRRYQPGSSFVVRPGSSVPHTLSISQRPEFRSRHILFAEPARETCCDSSPLSDAEIIRGGDVVIAIRPFFAGSQGRAVSRRLCVPFHFGCQRHCRAMRHGAGKAPAAPLELESSYRE